MASSSSTKTNDVFLSFRGEDIRRNFISHLHSALGKANINTYIDNNMTKGDTIWPALCRAIESSRISVIIFSENYATSKWCLEELTKILECRKTHAQVVIPVFYEVDPSHVRKHEGSYREAFIKHDEQSLGEYKVSQWKAALTEAANISGWDSNSHDSKNDSQLIEKIVKDVSEKLNLIAPYELEVKNLVGIEGKCEDVKLLLSKNPKRDMEPKSGRVIGIWGMGGIGKTTIAKAVFSEIFSQYDSVCFLQNVREESKLLGLISLHERLLSGLLKDENLKYNHLGSTFTTGRLRNKKVLIVLDDVDNVEQLDDLCREYEHASSKSKLIITTRDKHLLRSRVDEDDIYEVKALSNDKSRELFILQAFKRHPLEGHEDLLERAVKYAGGVPLALKILSSHLGCLKKIDLWEEELNKLKNYPLPSIHDVLRVSYERLSSLEQKLFLDIAFFFKDVDKVYAQSKLNACGFYATNGINSLEDKAFITISKGNKIQMHDLLQEMGLTKVRQDIEDPGKRSRLRDIEEVSDVLGSNKGSDAVEAIKLDLSEVDVLHLNPNAFNMMTGLRFLMLHIPLGKRSGNVQYPIAFDMFPAKLRYLEWHGYCLKSLPSTFSAKMLVVIKMPYSRVIKLWSGVQDVMNLEVIELEQCKHLKLLPDLSKASRLRLVNLTGCESLLFIHPSILSQDTLETLLLGNCKRLQSLKSEKRLNSLKYIRVDGCTSLKEFSLSSDVVRMLDLNYSANKEMYSSYGSPSKRWYLKLAGSRISNLPNELSSLEYLKHLRIYNCRVEIRREELHNLFNGLRCLETLHLKHCCYLFELPDNISGLSSLHDLRLNGSGVKCLPESIKHLENLQVLSLKNCRKLQCLPELPPSLNKLNADNCISMGTVSTLQTFSQSMIRDGIKDVFISFQNCKNLHRPSLHQTRDDAILIMMSAADKERSYEVKVCLPGSIVPRQFTYWASQSSVTINLPSRDELLGIVLCVVLSPSSRVNKLGEKIICECYLTDGTELNYWTQWYHGAIKDLTCDHVYIWCDAFFSHCIVSHHELQQISFRFSATQDFLNIRIKKCGVKLILKQGLQHEPTPAAMERYDFVGDSRDFIGDFTEEGSSSSGCFSYTKAEEVGVGASDVVLRLLCVAAYVILAFPLWSFDVEPEVLVEVSEDLIS